MRAEQEELERLRIKLHWNESWNPHELEELRFMEKLDRTLVVGEFALKNGYYFYRHPRVGIVKDQFVPASPQRLATLQQQVAEAAEEFELSQRYQSLTDTELDRLDWLRIEGSGSPTKDELLKQIQFEQEREGTYQKERLCTVYRVLGYAEPEITQEMMARYTGPGGVWQNYMDTHRDPNSSRYTGYDWEV